MTISQTARVLFAFLFVALFVFALWEALFGFGEISRRGALYPTVIGLAGLTLALATFARESRNAFADEAALDERPGGARRTLQIWSWVFGFVGLIWALGFVAAAPLATALFLRLWGRERWLLTVAVSVGAWLFFSGVMDCRLHVLFPEGALAAAIEDAIGLDLRQLFRVPFVC